MLEILQNSNIVENKEDYWVWQGKTEENYAVKSSYQIITSLGEGQETHGYKFLWDKSIPLKVGAFCRRVLLNKIPSVETLQKRGLVIGTQLALCYFSKNNLETCTHLFVYCNFSYCIWMYVYNWIGLDTVLAGNLEELLLQHNGLFKGKGTNRV